MACYAVILPSTRYFIHSRIIFSSDLSPKLIILRTYYKMESFVIHEVRISDESSNMCRGHCSSLICKPHGRAKSQNFMKFIRKLNLFLTLKFKLIDVVSYLLHTRIFNLNYPIWNFISTYTLMWQISLHLSHVI